MLRLCKDYQNNTNRGGTSRGKWGKDPGPLVNMELKETKRKILARMKTVHSTPDNKYIKVVGLKKDKTLKCMKLHSIHNLCVLLLRLPDKQ